MTIGATDSLAFYTKHDVKRAGTVQSYSKNPKKDRPVCTYCGYGGHVVDKCYKLQGYPPGYMLKQKSGPSNQVGYNCHSNNVVANQIFGSIPNQSHGNVEDFMQTLSSDQCQHLISVLSAHLTTAKVEDEGNNADHVSGTCLSVSISPIVNSPEHWVLDLGATSLVCFRRACFQTLKAVQNAYITLSNHARIPVHFVGSVKLTPDLVLEDVLFVPQFKINLLSISALTRNSSMSIRFLIDHCDIQDLYSFKMIGNGKKIGGLYILDATHSEMKIQCNSSKPVCISGPIVVNNVNSYTWHNRLDHLSFKRLEYLKDQLHFKNDIKNVDVPCSICPLAKQRRLSFVSHNHLSPNAFDLIHGDIWGPYRSPTRDGHRYFLTLVYDCTRFTWVYLLKQKSNVFDIIPKFFNLIETQF